MIIKRTKMANRMAARSMASTQDAWGDYPAIPHADTVHEMDYPTHSLVLGPDGVPLEYEPPTPMGFDLTSRKG